MRIRTAPLVAFFAAFLFFGCGNDAGRIDEACTSNSGCADTERCAQGTCGSTPGVCVERPTSCPDDVA